MLLAPLVPHRYVQNFLPTAMSRTSCPLCVECRRDRDMPGKKKNCFLSWLCNVVYSIYTVTEGGESISSASSLVVINLIIVLKECSCHQHWELANVPYSTYSNTSLLAKMMLFHRVYSDHLSTADSWLCTGPEATIDKLHVPLLRVFGVRFPSLPLRSNFFFGPQFVTLCLHLFGPHKSGNFLLSSCIVGRGEGWQIQAS